MRLFGMLVAAMLAAAGPGRAETPLSLFTVGAGDLSGVYYAVARATCRTFNAAANGDLRCSPEPTEGSVYNLTKLRAGEFDFALAQSDWQSAAYAGRGPFAAAGPAEWLRSVASLYPEPVTIVARDDPTLVEAIDLIGRRVDLGPVASGGNATVRALLRRMDRIDTRFAAITTYDPRRALQEVCAGRVDAAIMVVGHPNALVADAIERCGARILPLDGEEPRRVAREAADYSTFTIPAGLYRGQAAVRTLAVHATLVTRADVDPALVAAVAEALMAARDSGSGPPQLFGASVTAGGEGGLIAPLHPGVADPAAR